MSALDINWGMIGDGVTFEALMEAVVFSEDSSVRLFGKPGKDQGIDARSADGTRIYQAKYIRSQQIDDAIDAAVRELNKIKDFKSEGHPNRATWLTVREWTLVANVYSNNYWSDRWEREVVEPFRSLGIEASLWGCEILEQTLRRNPELREAFFGAGNRTLLYPVEAYSFLRKTIPGIPFDEMTFSGRDNEVKAVLEFIDSSSDRVAFVTGAHGVGRSRLMYECFARAAEGCRAYWGVPEAMVKSDRWFASVCRPGKVALFVDDCDNPSLLKEMLSMVCAKECTDWKLVVSYPVESAMTLQPILLPYKDCPTISLKPGTSSDVSAACSQLLQGADSSVAQHIYQYTKGNYSFVSFLLDSVRRYGREFLSDDILKWASHYLSVALNGVNDDLQCQIMSVLRRISLVGQITLSGLPDDGNRLYLIGGDVRNLDEALLWLRRINLLRYARYDGDRYSVLSPLFQQLVLSEWLFTDTGSAHYVVNDEGRALVQRILKDGVGGFTDIVLDTLSGLAFTYLPDSGGESFLRPIFEEIRHSINQKGTSLQYSCIELLKSVGRSDPEAALEIVDAVLKRKDVPEDEASHPYWGRMTIKREDVLGQLPELVFNLADFVKWTDKRLLRRFLEIFEQLMAIEEEGAFKLVGMSTASLIQRLLTPIVGRDKFVPVAFELVNAGMEHLADSKFLNALATALLTVVRSSSEVCGRSFVITRGLVPPDVHCSSWVIINRFWDLIWKRLGEETDERLRLALWRLISQGVASFYGAALLRGRGGDENAITVYKSVALDALKAIHARLSAGGISECEVSCMRDIWHRYLPVSDDHPADVDEFEAVAKTCEEQYLQGDDETALARRCYRTVSRSSAARGELIGDVAQKLFGRSGQDEDGLKKFFDVAKIALSAGGRDERWSDYGITSELASACKEEFSLDGSGVVSRFVSSAIQAYPNDNSLIDIFAYSIVARTVRRMKVSSPDSVVGFLRDVLEMSRDDRTLALDLYRNTQAWYIGELTRGEFSVLREKVLGEDFRAFCGLVPPFVKVAGSEVLEMLEKAFKKWPDKAGDLVWKMVNTWYLQLIREEITPDKIPTAWLMDRITLNPQVPLAIFGNYEFQKIYSMTGGLQTCDKLVEILKSGRDFPYGANLACYFGGGEDRQLETLCAWIVGDCDAKGITAFFNLPSYLAMMDNDGEVARHYIESHGGFEKLEGEALVIRLIRLARLASCYDNTAKAWEGIALQILAKAEMLPRESKYRVFSALGPAFKTFGGVIGEIPKEIRERYERAKRKLEELEGSSALSEFESYRKWDFEDAKREFDAAVERAEEDRKDA